MFSRVYTPVAQEETRGLVKSAEAFPSARYTTPIVVLTKQVELVFLFFSFYLRSQPELILERIFRCHARYETNGQLFINQPTRFRKSRFSRESMTDERFHAFGS